MKRKVLSILLATILVMGLIATGCGANNAASDDGTTTNTANTANTANTDGGDNATNTDEAENTTGAGTAGTEQLTLGVGAVTSIAKSAAATADKAGNAETDSTVAAVIFDSGGKIVKCVLDALQTKIAFGTDGAITTDLTKAIESKNVLGDAYGLTGARGNWQAQAQAFADWTVGKTVADLKGLALTPAGATDGHPGAPTEADLAAKISISVADFITAIENAETNKAEEATFTADPATVKLGLSVTGSTAKSTNATADKAGNAQSDGAIAAVAVNSSDKILATVVDAIQSKIAIDTTGAITTDLTKAVQTKNELGDAYGLTGERGNWADQARAFSTWTVGKTIADVKGVALGTGTEAGVPTDADLAAKISISVDGFMKNIEQAVASAK